MKRTALLMLVALFLTVSVWADKNTDVCSYLVEDKLVNIQGSRDEDIAGEKSPDIEAIINGIINSRNPHTNLSPSHLGHPGYEHLAFLYDKTVDALILKAAGRQKEAEAILDYFVRCFNISVPKAITLADTNNIYGIIKLIKYDGKVSKSFINSINIDSERENGRGILEFWTTPGPMAFLILTMMNVNDRKYKDTAVEIGSILANMQDDRGGMRDGDRAPDRVHTEPHMDVYDAFLALYKVTGDNAWKIRADNAYKWFEKNVYHPESGVIDQGLWSGSRSDIFAEDVYSWTMAGPAGDRMSAEVLKRLTENMLKQSLVKVTLTLPDGAVKTVILVDFSNPKDERVMSARGGFHPLGSVEWTGGAILALEKNAVRFWNSGDTAAAKQYKAMAEILFTQTMKCFYRIDALDGKITFYATGQGYEVAPFGSIKSGFSSGWMTPSFLAMTYDGEKVIKGGSSVGAWPILPYLGLNPFILGDGYKKIYDKIPLTKEDRISAFDFIDNIASGHYFNEVMCKRTSEPPTQIIEPVVFNIQMWLAIKSAEAGKSCGKDRSCYQDAIKWAQKIVSDPVWVKLAKRDNAVKMAEHHGIIAYPWGMAYKENTHPIHRAIGRYPLLNEVGCAMWGLARSNFELGNYDQTKYWMGRIIDDVPLHQIAATQEEVDAPGEHVIIGYWNALVSWEANPGGDLRTGKMSDLYREVLAEKGLSRAMPDTVELSGTGGQLIDKN